MDSLDYYDPLQLGSWHHFAYRAIAPAVAELGRDLAAHVEQGDDRPLEEFFRRHRTRYHQLLCSAKSEVSGEEIERVLAAWRGAPELFDEYGPELARALGEARRALPLPGGGPLVRCLWDPVSTPDDDLAYLGDLVRYGAPEELIADRRRACVEALDQLARGALPPLPEVPDGFRELLEGAIDLCLVDPFQENVGLWRLYDVGFDPPGPIGRPLVADPYPEGREPVAYGLEGSGLSVVGPDRAAEEAGALRSFEPTLERLRAHAAERVRRELENENDEDDDDELDAEALAAAIGALEREWSETRDRLAGALDQVARGECVLLQWTSKDPAL